ncbi:MAG TPA: gamma-glutamyl-gamma-aminobutyrate hydrolase family protein [Polyangiaceae bacterium]|nr:gamma-glutamyl-gamma-aminobutyrate hydrolase family protein [Polyangiaceae bacterium]
MIPVIGITVCIDAGRLIRPNVDYLYLGRRYAQAVAAAGAMPVLLSPEAKPADCLSLCSGLVISGGGDLPRHFAASRDEATLREAEHLDRISWEREVLTLFAQANRPVLGVCYGMQLMNLHFGGSLYRSVTEEERGILDHGGGGRSQKHEVERSAESVLLESLPKRFLSNSSHGQAVREVAPGFVVSARADDGVIEAIENAAAKLFGVEWHPESDATGSAVYGKFASLVQGVTKPP